MKITKNVAGKDKNGNEILTVELENNYGMCAKITNIGCAVISLVVKDKDGNPVDVVLGYDDIEQYFNNPGYMGVVVGPFANRMKNAEFSIDGTKYNIENNEGNNCLHSGSVSFSHRTWNFVKTNEDVDTVSVTFSIENSDNNGGFPGNTKTEVKYSLTDSGKLVVTYKATSDKNTVINLTQHSYFNLNGYNKQNILNHKIFVDSDKYVKVDNENIPTGELINVENTVFDLRTPKLVSECTNEIPTAYDNCFELNKRAEVNRPQAVLISEETGIKLDMFTSEPGVQVYAGGFLPNVEGKSGKTIEQFNGICLEAQHYPDSPNHDNFPSTILEAGKEYHQTTIFRFSNI